MRRQRLALALVLATWLSGCVRAGFDVHSSEGGAASDGLAVSELAANPLDTGTAPDGPPPTGQYSANKAHDTCGSPLVVDLAPLASGGTVTVAIDTTGAQNDYGNPACGGAPELVLLVKNGPPTVRVECSGGGMWGKYVPLQCNDALATGNTTSCASGVATEMSLQGQHIVVCRDPAAGPIKVVLSKPKAP